MIHGENNLVYVLYVNSGCAFHLFTEYLTAQVNSKTQWDTDEQQDTMRHRWTAGHNKKQVNCKTQWDTGEQQDTMRHSGTARHWETGEQTRHYHAQVNNKTLWDAGKRTAWKGGNIFHLPNWN